MRRKFLLTLISLFLIAAGALADQSYQMYVNGARSKFAPIKTGDQLVVPLDFPVLDTETEWDVKVAREGKTGRVNVTMAPKKRKTRGDNPCHVCTSTGLCQTCYPAGSGNTTSGQPDYMCTGSGKCWYCKGEGKW